MQAVFRLILEGLAMFAGSWAAGCVPLYVKMSSSKFSLLALFGAGLLIGAALAVILPEGVETMTRAVLARRPGSTEGLADAVNSAVGWALVAGFCVMFLIDNLFASHAHGSAGGIVGADAADGAATTNDSGTCLEEIPMTHQAPSARGGRGGSDYTLNGADASRAASDSMTTLNIDHNQHRASHSPAAALQAAAQKPQWRCVLQKLGRAVSPWNLPSTLLGILVHSCADGLALGAAVAAAAASEASASPRAGGGGSSSLEIIVFFALLLHKAPAAFGLITTLKQQGFAHYKLSIWLTMFAASAPLAALATFAVFLLAAPSSPSPGAAKEAAAVQPWTGVVMLFSAGTFMYVAMAHTLTEAVAQARALRAKAAGNARMARLAFLDIAVLLLGIILPPLVSKDHDD
ncbi:hypothetical protein GGI11_005366 [Coemansia sp. RSA 2049]|nr:hypothetical protein H4217_008035 [Coemansia sp. RSA 1939]KAJ2510749.1 hypothetical protein GGI11_005366 [Coemansia sp. RSA 2049]KAJ2593961.1 hypothetical protein EV177_008471 [Coemansia sp. RSA 1804]KAJ2670724.1 hypothetical protein GGH99_006230 [Coemansia sp. RSA 1285]